jgi:hypothetical protein
LVPDVLFFVLNEYEMPGWAQARLGTDNIVVKAATNEHVRDRQRNVLAQIGTPSQWESACRTSMVIPPRWK